MFLTRTTWKRNAPGVKGRGCWKHPLCWIINCSPKYNLAATNWTELKPLWSSMVSCWLLLCPESCLSPTFFSYWSREKSIHKSPHSIFLCQVRWPPQETQKISFRVFFLLPTWVSHSTTKAQILIKNDCALKKTLFDCKNLKFAERSVEGSQMYPLRANIFFHHFLKLLVFHFGRKMQVFQLCSWRDFPLEAENLAVRIPG